MNLVEKNQINQKPVSVQQVTENPVHQSVPDSPQSPVDPQPQPTPIPPQPLSEPEVPRTGVPTSPSSKGSNKILLIGLPFVITAAIIGGGYLYLQNQKLKSSLSQSQPSPTPTQEPSPTPDPTADWNTYTSEKIWTRYSLEYPPRFTVDDEPKSSLSLINPQTSSVTLYILLGSTGTMGMPKQTLKEYANPKNSMFAGETILEQKEIKISDLPALRTVSSNNQGKIFIEVYIEDPNKPNNFYYFVNVDAEDLSEIEFDQILSTFKFLD